MFPLGKLLGIWAVQRTLKDTTIFHQLLAGAATLILLTVVAAFMVGALLIGAFYVIHMALIAYGLTADAACITVICLAILVTVILILVIYTQVQKLQTMLRQLLNQQSPITTRLTEVATAFIDGLMTPPRHPYRKE